MCQQRKQLRYPMMIANKLCSKMGHYSASLMEVCIQFVSIYLVSLYRIFVLLALKLPCKTLKNTLTQIVLIVMFIYYRLRGCFKNI